MAKRPVNHEALFNQMPVTRFLIEKSGDKFVVCDVNKLALEFFNKKREDIVGKAIEELFIESNARRMAESLKVCISKKTAVTVPPLPSFPGNINL